MERTFSEYKSGQLVQTLVSDYATLPPELQAGAIQNAYNAAIVAGTGGNYADGTSRYFSCQTCHMQPITGVGCDKNGTPIRSDLPMHDLTGGNYWMPFAIHAEGVGAKVDLLEEDKTGFVYANGNNQVLAEILFGLARAPEKVKQLGKNSANLAQKYDYKFTMLQFRNALKELRR